MRGFVLMGLISLASGSLAQASVGDFCQARQELEARIKFAKEVGRALDEVSVRGFQNGNWTQATGNNVGSDQVRVGALDDGENSWITTAYKVSGHQIDESQDCRITGIESVRR